MQSAAKSVDDYLNEVPLDRKPALMQLRNLCRTVLSDFEESMRYGMPCYARNGEVEAAFANQKNFIALYILKTDVMNAHRHLLNGKGVSMGKGCIRYAKPEKIDFAVVEMMLKATGESTGAVCD